MKRRNFLNLFAAGAVLTEPVLEHVKKSTGNPEMVAPADVLNVQPPMVYIPDIRLDGRDLQVVLKRSEEATTRYK